MPKQRKKRSHLELELAAALETDGDFPAWEWDYQFNKPRTKHDMDFAWVRIREDGVKVVRGVEVHGSLWAQKKDPKAKFTGGAHSHPLGLLRDSRKLNFAATHPTDDVQYMVVYCKQIQEEQSETVEKIRRMLLIAGFNLVDPNAEVAALLAGDLD